MPPTKHSNIKAWLDRHPRFTFHFTPTLSSWFNQVEGFFGILTDKVIRNTNLKPFTWVADAEAILEKIARGGQTLDQIQEKQLQS